MTMPGTRSSSSGALPVSLRGVTPVLLVGDIAATIPWYTAKLGFAADAVPRRPPHAFCILQRDAVTLFLQQLDGYRKPEHYHERPGGVWAAYFHTSGLRAWYDELKGDPEIELVQPLRQQPFGQLEFEVRDPNGYLLVFAEPL